MQIGTFTRSGNGFSGQVRTLTIERSVSLEPVDSQSDRAPDFRVFIGGFEGGIGYCRTSERGHDYISLVLDDPTFPKAIWCNLLLGERPTGLPLMWDRPKRKS